MQTNPTPRPNNEARWMLHLSPVMFLVGAVFLVVNLVDWVKSPSLLWAANLVGDCGFLLFGAAGYGDAKYTLRTGIKRLSAGRVAGLFLVLLGKIGRHESQHTSALFPPWLLGVLVLATLYGAAWATLRERRGNT